MTRFAKNLLKAAVMRMPWGANEALFEALCVRMGPAEIMARCAPRLDYLQLCASGRYGLIQSAPQRRPAVSGLRPGRRLRAAAGHTVSGVLRPQRRRDLSEHRRQYRPDHHPRRTG